MKLYIIEPEVAGGIGENTVYDACDETTKSIEKHGIIHLHYVFEGWLGDDILESTPCFLVSQRLKNLIEKEKLTGCEFEDIEVSYSDMFNEMYQNCDMPEFYRLIPKGSVEIEGDIFTKWDYLDFCMTKKAYLVISERAKKIIETCNINNADISEISSGDISYSINTIKKKMHDKNIEASKPVTIDKIREYEEKNHILLPKELVLFYTEICNGCKMIDGFELLSLEAWKCDSEKVSENFPFEKCWIWEDDYDEERLKQITNGNIELIDIGDAQSWNIIVEGNEKGRMWLFTDVGIQPCSPAMNLIQWFEAWLDGEDDYFKDYIY